MSVPSLRQEQDPCIGELDRATARTQARYDRLALVYDRMEAGAERLFRAWRGELWRRVEGPRVLELGIGTGKNLPFYSPSVQVTGIDLSPRMLARAERRAAELGVPVILFEADAQRLPFDARNFDTVAATFVFCSVPDPVLGLREAYRVLAPGGRLILLEHVLSDNRILRLLMQAANPAVVRLMGANINRQTVRNVERAGFRIRSVEQLWAGIVKLIEAERPEDAQPAIAVPGDGRRARLALPGAGAASLR